MDKCYEVAEELLEKYDMEVIAHYMDDEIRERLHMELAPCSDLEFVAHYIKEHDEAYGEEYTIN